MVAYGGFLTDDEIWAVITYEHTFADSMEQSKVMGNAGSAIDDRPMRPHEGGCCQMPQQKPKLESKP